MVEIVFVNYYLQLSYTLRTHSGQLLDFNVQANCETTSNVLRKLYLQSHAVHLTPCPGEHGVHAFYWAD